MASKKLQQIMNDDKEYLFQNYGDRLPACFVRGDGSYLFDQDNQKYVDFFSGIAVSCMGYNNKILNSALHRQIDNLIHVSNLFYNREQIEAARLISKLSFQGKTLFVNSGTEANEAAIKLARRYGLSSGPEKYRIITFHGSFHGRTFGGLSATAQEKIRKGFGPILPGFIYCPMNDIETFKKEIQANPVCAIMIEMIQGENGIKIADKNFIKELFEVCRQNEILTIVDEVQTGVGRTGKSFAFQHFNVDPDVITLAKGLGGGLPIGALHARSSLVKYFEKGSHGSTFGGNNLACSAAVAVLKEIGKEKFLANVNKNSSYIFQNLRRIKDNAACIREVRGMGLHIGIELNRSGIDLVKKALLHGLIINCTADNVIRIMPPLNIPFKTVKEGIRILETLLLEEK